MRAKYATVKIPIELARALETITSEGGYRSRAEIVNDAIRRFLERQKSPEKKATDQGSRAQESR